MAFLSHFPTKTTSLSNTLLTPTPEVTEEATPTPETEKVTETPAAEDTDVTETPAAEEEAETTETPETAPTEAAK